jgi:N-acyl-phosphatidylethanolamine-hydrolysing phospholipase D
VKEHHTPSGRFENIWATRPPRGHTNVLRWALAHRKTRPKPRDPDPSAFERATPDFVRPRAGADALTLTWVGHSTFLIQIGGLNVLTDPMWSDRASPLRFVGPKRWVPPGIALDELPPIDVVVLSHDHYDHLDAWTVKQLAARYPEARWLAPLRLGQFLRKQGADAVTEMDWWDALTMHDTRFACVPAQHHSARGLRDRRRSLWCGWVISCVAQRVYFAGDTAYFPGFNDIGAKYGPFDACLMPIGGYLPREYMKFLHMTPAEAVRAFGELNAAGVERERREGVGRRKGEQRKREPVFVPMHWGTFKISDEAMDEPVALLEKAWRESGAEAKALWLLMHGETRTGTSHTSDPPDRQ